MTTIRSRQHLDTVPGVDKRSFRPDIEGLRALAVVLVVLDHMLLFPRGGFIGVDVFFVISGFLITGLLLREHKRTGTIAFGQFYVRRVKRLAPVALLVVLVTVAAGYYLLSVARAGQVARDGLFATFFAANWNFAAQGTDYFSAGQDVSPLQHYWSLSVEEQFYLVWPWLLLVVLTIAGKVLKGRRRDLVVGGSFGVVAVASFAWACWSSFAQPSVAYFDTFGRVWELAVGASLALAVPFFARVPRSLRTVLAYVGLAGIVASALVITSALPFPGPWALLPVLSTAVVIAAGCGGTSPALWPLTNVVARYLGRISFSVYLWHFPVIVFVGLFVPRGESLFVPLVVSSVVVLSVLSFHFVEDPLRKAKLPARKQVHGSRGELQINKIAIGALAFVAAGALALSVGALVRVVPADRGQIATAAGSDLPADEPVEATTADERLTSIQQALAADEWPELTPDAAAFTNGGRDVVAAEWVTDGCLGEDYALLEDPFENTAHCTFGNAAAGPEQTAVVLGDSVAISYVPALRQALGADWKVRVMTLAACPVSDVATTRVGGATFPECADFRRRTMTEVESLRPALTVVSEAADDNRLVSGASGADADDEWRDGATASMTSLRDLGGTVLYLSRPPVGTSLFECQTAVSVPDDCVTEVEQGQTNRNALFRDTMQGLGGAVVFQDTTSWFCNLGQCPVFIGDVPTFADGRHLTNTASIALAGLMRTAVDDAVAVGAPAGP